MASGATKTEAKRVSNFFFLKKTPIWPRVQPKSRPKGYRIFFKKKKEAHMASGAFKTEAKRPRSMASGSSEPRQKGPLWLRFLTEAKSYALLASPQYASVPEPVQNIKNNRCQRPFLHWWQPMYFMTKLAFPQINSYTNHIWLWWKTHKILQSQQSLANILNCSTSTYAKWNTKHWCNWTAKWVQKLQIMTLRETKTQQERNNNSETNSGMNENRNS